MTRSTTQSRCRLLSPGHQFAFEFDFGDSWQHLCTVHTRLVDPEEAWGAVPDRPVSYFGWGDLPDQYGRTWQDDDGSGTWPQPPDPPTSDLPPLLPGWGNEPSSGGGGLMGIGDTNAWDEESWRRLRAAFYSKDGREIVDVLLHCDLLEIPQMAGDGILIALDQGIDEAAWLARRLRDSLPFDDDVLAQQLDAALGVAPSPDLKPVYVDLDELATHLDGEGDLERCRLDVITGEFWPDDVVGLTGIEPPDYWDDNDRWIEVYGIGSRAGWRDMADFVGQIQDRDLAQRLERALRGKGAFRRFRDIVFDHEDLGWAWHRFSDDRKRGRARAWLAEAGYRVSHDSPDG